MKQYGFLSVNSNKSKKLFRMYPITTPEKVQDISKILVQTQLSLIRNHEVFHVQTQLNLKTKIKEISKNQWFHIQMQENLKEESQAVLYRVQTQRNPK